MLQSTTPTTTPYYASTTLSYKVLLQYYDKVLLQYYSVLQSTSLFYKVLLQDFRETLMTDPSYICEMSFAMRGATQFILQLQHHQILHLPRKAALMIDPRYTRNVIDKAWNNRSVASLKIFGALFVASVDF